MATSGLNQPHFQDADKARAYLERLRWPAGKAICPHCGSVAKHYELKGESHRAGLWKCRDCREQFSVTVGTVFERSKIALHVWLQAVYLLSSSKKGMSSHQLHRTLGVTYKTAWFMTHRIREAMRSDSFIPMGQGGGGVEIDETYIGQDRPRAHGHRGGHHKRKVLSLVDRNTGRAKSIVIESVTVKTLVPILRANIAREARILSDDAVWYAPLSLVFGGHEAVNHSKYEYVRPGNRSIHTNTVEGFFSIFKRGMKGVYQHCGKQHLHRYLAEFDFRYSNRAKLGIDDAARADIALRGIANKRITYA